MADQEAEELPPLRKGKFVFPNGDRYEGQFRLTAGGAVERFGEGTHTSLTGMVYKGAWRGDKMNGHGRLVFPSGDVYEGDFVDNHYQGKGRYQWTNGCVYNGDFNRNRLEGAGEFCDEWQQDWTGAFHDSSAYGLRFKLMM